MPTYEYECTSCGHAWEQEQRIVEPPMDTCPACSCKTAKRLVSASNFILKGGGWYADLYSAPSKNKDRKSNGGEARTPAKTTSESKSSDSSNAATPSSTSSTPTSTPSSGN